MRAKVLAAALAALFASVAWAQQTKTLRVNPVSLGSEKDPKSSDSAKNADSGPACTRRGEQIVAMNRICHYDCAGGKVLLVTLSVSEICPARPAR